MITQTHLSGDAGPSQGLHVRQSRHVLQATLGFTVVNVHYASDIATDLVRLVLPDPGDESNFTGRLCGKWLYEVSTAVTYVHVEKVIFHCNSGRIRITNSVLWVMFGGWRCVGHGQMLLPTTDKIFQLLFD